MKIHNLICGISAALVLAGCTTADRIEFDGDRYFRVFQTLSDGALAQRWDKAVGTTCLGMVVFIPSHVDRSMYDEKLIHMVKPEITGRYNYTTVKGVEKTVPIFVDFGESTPSIEENESTK